MGDGFFLLEIGMGIMVYGVWYLYEKFIPYKSCIKFLLSLFFTSSHLMEWKLDAKYQNLNWQAFIFPIPKNILNKVKIRTSQNFHAIFTKFLSWHINV